jgi:hypothetical protein
MHETVRVPFSELNEPGAYINERTGELYRVPNEALTSGRSPLIEIVSDQATMMTKLSDNAWIQISKARQLAADSDVLVAF